MACLRLSWNYVNYSHTVKQFQGCCQSVKIRPPSHLKRGPHITSVRTIVYNEKLVERGLTDKFGSAFSREGGLDSFGTFAEMEEFMTDYVPDLLINVSPSLQELTIYNAWPTHVIAHSFNNLQMITGLPWYASISLLAVCVKLSMYPFHIWWRKEFQTQVKTAPLQITSFLQTYFANVIKVDPVEALKLAYTARVKTCKDLNLPLLPHLFPIYATLLAPVATVCGLSYLANLTYEPLLTGGALWFTNLSEPDPYCLLPILNSALIIVNARFHPFGLLLPKPVYGVKYPAPLLLLSISQLWFSSAILIYWMSANTMGLVIQLLLHKPEVRTFHGLESKVQVFEPLLNQSSSLISIGNEIEESRTKLLLIKKEEIQLLEEMKTSSSDEVRESYATKNRSL